MKKLLACVLALILIGCAALAEIDLSGMSYEELVALKDQINLAIWNSAEWQEVEVPTGVWVVGEDIPAGWWTVRPATENEYFYVSVFDEINDTSSGPRPGCGFYENCEISAEGEVFGTKIPTEASIELKDGWYFKTTGYAIFTTYSGKPDLGFK